MTKIDWVDVYRNTRLQTNILCKPLMTEDYVIQGMEDVSPPEWHLAHSTWFFETVILEKMSKTYRPFHPVYQHLFNSYYQSAGPPFERAKRGLLSRPGVAEIADYRNHVDENMLELLEKQYDETLESLLILGIHHEQQHQELLLMDIKYNFSLNPLFPAYISPIEIPTPSLLPLNFSEIAGGIARIGHEEKTFSFDNEQAVHEVIIEDFQIANRLISNGEFLQFMREGGYKDPRWWLADGWDWCLQNQIQHPLYWHYQQGSWYEFNLSGLKPLIEAAPVIHISFFEADAFARWCACRLPTEEEWEYCVKQGHYTPATGNFLEKKLLQAQVASDEQFFGDAWEWTSSAYSAYPRYRPFSGLLSEYNGKFMNNQRVLRGGSCITPQMHIRVSYRNFFQSDKRWPFCGIRLAKNGKESS